MKRFVCTTLALGLTALAALAQTPDLSDVFEGKVVAKDEMVETFLGGSRLEPYHLTMFHSVKFFASDAEVAKVAAAVLEDFDQAVEKETVFASGKLIYAILVFTEKERDLLIGPGVKVDKYIYNRFVCYQLTETEGARQMVTLVEMKGTAQLEDLKALFTPADDNN